MATYTVAWEEGGSVTTLWSEVVAAGIPITGIDQTPGALIVTTSRDLTAPEIATAQGIAADILGALHTRDLSLTLAEYRAIEPDIDGLRTYLGIASPTAAQTVLATKAIIRILRALISD
jgi:hypothetical protein